MRGGRARNGQPCRPRRITQPSPAIARPDGPRTTVAPIRNRRRDWRHESKQQFESEIFRQDFTSAMKAGASIVEAREFAFKIARDQFGETVEVTPHPHSRPCASQSSIDFRFSNTDSL